MVAGLSHISLHRQRYPTHCPSANAPAEIESIIHLFAWLGLSVYSLGQCQLKSPTDVCILPDDYVDVYEAPLVLLDVCTVQTTTDILRHIMAPML